MIGLIFRNSKVIFQHARQKLAHVVTARSEYVFGMPRDQIAAPLATQLCGRDRHRLSSGFSMRFLALAATHTGRLNIWPKSTPQVLRRH
jgi:hypothetical protein